MGRTERLEELRRLLESAEEALGGAELAERFGVSRQAIVQDVALLRNRGVPIRTTAQGYRVERALSARRLVPVRHGPESIRSELSEIVALGGRVRDVIVDHPLYGELRGNLDVGTPEQVLRFANLLERSGSVPLSNLSGGFHLHTVEAPDEEALDRIEARLDELGLLAR